MSILRQLYPGDEATILSAVVLVQVTVVVLVAWILASTFARRSAATQHGVWLSSLLGVLLCIPATYSIHRGGLQVIALPIITPDRGSQASAMLTSVRNADGGKYDAIPQVNSPDAASSSIGLSNSRSRTGTGLSRADQWRAGVGAALAIWALGACFFLVRFARGCLQLRQLSGRVIPLSKNRLGRDISAELEDAFGVHRLPQLATSRGLRSPIAVGIFRPMVVLPESMVTTLPSTQLRDVLLHECAHIVRRDTLIGVLQRLAELLFWPHPLVHWLNRNLTLAREQVCDNYVLLRSDARSFGQTLLRLSECMAYAGVKPAALGLFEPRWPLERRVAGLVDPRRIIMTRTNRMLGAVSIIATLSIVLSIGATTMVRAGSANAETGGVAEDSDRTTERNADPDAETKDVASDPVKALKANKAVVHLNDQGEVVQVNLFQRSRDEDLEKVTKLNWATTRSKMMPNDATAQWTTLPSLEIRRVKLSDKGFSRLRELNHLRSLALYGVTYNGNELKDADLGVLVENLPLLEELVVTDAQIGDEGLTHLRHLPNLSFLSLSNNQITDAGLEQLTDVQFPKLTHLRVRYNEGITDKGVRVIAQIAPNLKTLNVAGTQLTNAALADLKTLRHLDYLVVSETQITDAGLAHFKDFPNLVNLRLDKNRLSDAGMIHLKDLTRIGGLNLFGTDISDVGLSYLKNLRNLRYLNLMNTGVTDEGLATLKGFPRLAYLALDGTAITDNGMAHLAGLRSLEIVGLAGTQVGDLGLSHLRGMTKLWRLRLQGTQVTGLGVEHLADLPLLSTLTLGNIAPAGVDKLIQLKALESLWVGGGNLSDEQVAKLKNGLADCNIQLSRE